MSDEQESTEPAPQATPPSGLARAYTFELLFESAPELDQAALTAALEARFETVVPMGEDALKSVGFAFPGLGDIPAQVHILNSTVAFDPQRVQGLVDQTWGWDEAAATVARGTRSLLVTDLLGTRLARKVRLDVLRRSLAAFIETLQPTAMLCPLIQQVIDPAEFLAGVSEPINRLFGFLNVRLFRVEDRRENEVVMDTLGLAAIGLTDVQCHFAGLDATEMANLLHRVGAYIFDQEPAIKDGHTVEGLDDGRWIARHEDALVGPERTVLDLDAGAPASARE